MSDLLTEPPAGGVVRDEFISVPGGRHAVRIRDTGARLARMPLVLHLHGGRFVGGDAASGDRVAGWLAAAGAVVVSLDYPLAPAHPFPAAVEAAHAVLQALHKRRRGLAGTGARLFVAGEEAGGNLAAAAALVARDRHGPELAGQVLLAPMLDACVGTASLRGVKAGPVGCPYADGWAQYLARPDDALHPYAAPARTLRLEGLPPALIVSADDDPLRDEAAAYARRLRAAGVEAESLRLPAPTGWPTALSGAAAAPATPPAWEPVLRERLRRFLQVSEAAR